MDTPVSFRPEQVCQTYLRLIVLIIGVLIIAPAAIPIIFIPDVIGQIVLGAVAAIEAIIIILIYSWVPYYVRSLEYLITDETVEFRGGVFWKRWVTVPFVKITNVDITQSPLERWFGVGTVHVQTAGAGGAQGARAELRLSGIADLDNIRNLIMARVGVRTDANGGSGASVAVVSKAAVASGSDALLGTILTELKAIRSLLSSGR